MPGTPNFGDMTTEEFAQWQAQQSVRPADVMPVVPVDPYAETAAAWLSDEFDFDLPSGSKCRMRKMPLKELATKGILDRVTRLPGIVEEVIEKSENKPPKPAVDDIPDNETIEALDLLLNIIVPLVVVQPKVWEIPESGERVAGRIYPDTIELSDRVAIMERSMAGVKGLDSFRQ
jgi:hypothetical protein